MPFLFPVVERYALLGEALYGSVGYFADMEYGAYGVIAYTDVDRQITEDDLSSIPHGERPSIRLVVADSPWKSLWAFKSDVPGAACGFYPAVTIDRKRPILELPECLMLQEDAESCWYCVSPNEDEEEEDIPLCPLGIHELPELEECAIAPFLHDPKLLLELGLGRRQRIGRYSFIISTLVVEPRS